MVATTLTLDGYIANVLVDFDAGIMHGEVINTRDVLTFSGTSIEEVKTAFAETLADYREWCAAEGVEPEKPFSGSLTLRLKPQIHRMAATRAAIEGVSLSAWLVKTIECELGARPSTLTAVQMNSRIAQAQDEVIKAISSRIVMGDADEELWAQKVTVQ